LAQARERRFVRHSIEGAVREGNATDATLRGDRRAFFAALLRGAVTAVAAAAASSVWATRLQAQAGSSQSAASKVEMTSDSYNPVRRDPKPGATPQMTEKQLEAFERELACPCPCTLDVYTCRTTDFNCGISPAVHKDIKALVDGGYTGDEIMAAMTSTYGDFILMTPRKQGFNLLAWFAPFAAVAIGAVAIGALLRSWRVNAATGSATRAAAAAADAKAAESAPFPPSTGLSATPDELARLQAALRNDGQ